MKYLINCFLIFSTICLFSCSNKITEDKAKELIIAEYEYPNVEFAKINLDIMGSNRNEPLYNLGLLIRPRGLTMSVGVSNEGLKYTIDGRRIGEFASYAFFASNTRAFDKITGILFLDDAKTKAKVEFTCVRNNITPFGEFLNFTEGEVSDYEIEMAKYEDDWRIINQENNVNYKLEDYPNIFKNEK